MFFGAPISQAAVILRQLDDFLFPLLHNRLSELVKIPELPPSISLYSQNVQPFVCGKGFQEAHRQRLLVTSFANISPRHRLTLPSMK